MEKTTETAKQSAVVQAVALSDSLVRHLDKKVQEESLQEKEMVSLFLASVNIYLMP